MKLANNQDKIKTVVAEKRQAPEKENGGQKEVSTWAMVTGNHPANTRANMILDRLGVGSEWAKSPAEWDSGWMGKDQ